MKYTIAVSTVQPNLVSVPLRGRGHEILDTDSIDEPEHTRFPSPCGEEVMKSVFGD